MTKEQKFHKALQDVFVGAKIEGEGGFINLMRIKSSYYSQIEKLLKDDIDKALTKYPKFREELFDKLYSFFSRYFTESGSIYFNSTPFHNNIYEKVYTDERDVILFWKTQMLYYVKTDRIFRSMPVEFGGFKFYFDAKNIENKKANEKRSLVFELKQVREDPPALGLRRAGGTITFTVAYSEKGRKTKADEILKALQKNGVAIKEEELEKAFRVFGKQSEVDFFINKNARAFLQEQFKLWSYQYFWDGAKEWSSERVDQLQILKDIAFKIIDFISQFEDELVKIWNKPKFVRNSNYVITLDRILSACHSRESGNLSIEKIFKDQGIKEQIKEWQELGIVDKKFSPSVILSGSEESKKYEHLPIDTKYFKELELEILALFDDLDNQLDGWLIKSENYQALNTILPKFKEKVQTIYIDPPFNTGKDFDYVDGFQDSSWLSLMQDRLSHVKKYLNNSGCLFLHLDYRADYYGRLILKNLFEENNFVNQIAYGYRIQGILQEGFPRKHDIIYLYAKNLKDFLFNSLKEKVIYNKPFIDTLVDKNDNRVKNLSDKDRDLIFKHINSGKVLPDKFKDILFNKYYSEVFVRDIWDHDDTKPMISGSKEYFNFKTQKSEGLLKRIIISTTNKKSIVMDFFSGIGTTISVAHKMGRKWIGVEMGEHFYQFKPENKPLSGILVRMKEVVAGIGNHEPCGISKGISWKGGGFFKYYELEQYEEALANCKYKDGDLFSVPGKLPYQEYIFMKDAKMLKALEIDYKKNKVDVDLSKLYSDPSAPLGTSIDIAETLSNLTGKWIKAIRKDEVEFSDGSKINTKELDYKLFKSLIWWE